LTSGVKNCNIFLLIGTHSFALCIAHSAFLTAQNWTARLDYALLVMCSRFKQLLKAFLHWTTVEPSSAVWIDFNPRAVFVKFQQGGWLFGGSQRPAADDSQLPSPTFLSHSLRIPKLKVVHG